MLRTDDGHIIRLEDYRPTDFAIHHVEMLVRLMEGAAEVVTDITLERRPETSETAPLVLDGDELVLTGLHLNGEPVTAEQFDASPDQLTVRGLPARGRFVLRVETRLSPETNTQLMGLYRSNGVWCTQCEAEGFRRITYFLDRPDVLATYRVRLEADRASAPVLLANGNPMESGELDGSRHFAVWDDPHPKPSYLFALVAGDLDPLEDRFTTASGRNVKLVIFTEKGLSHRATYAMDALKRSMVWDERRFGREYDLDVFNIVAISDFNMGAMENKGLNVFNHKYVLLDPDTATDSDYAGVETVIAHEYFHNWTGNRITCRDWFQLCLKEGLTVYRDQEFSADERSRPVKRISSVHGLKAQQFPEDQGPLQHPVRPTRYREINNFYTATVYEKGAELVRMIETILGAENFRSGMDLYFERHDGEAATIEDFLRCFEEAGDTDLSQFALWYHQAGTPTLTITEQYDGGQLTLILEQDLAKGAAGTGTHPFHMPIRFGLVSRAGEDLAIEPVAGEAEIEGDVIHLTTSRAELVFEVGGERPLVSILRDFSAPVTLRHDQPREARLALAALDPNPFGRWRALTDLTGDMLRSASLSETEGRGATYDPAVIEALCRSASDEALEPALRALMVTLPGEPEIARLIGSEIDPEAIHRARRGALRALAEAGGPEFERLRASLSDGSAPFSADAASAGRRALRAALLPAVAIAQTSAAPLFAEFEQASNMTDRLSAISALVQLFPGSDETRSALDAFYRRFESDALVLDKWFTLQATAPSDGSVEAMERLRQHPKFTLGNPNRARALIGGFASGNQRGFNRADGAGYRWVAEQLGELDRLNPQTAARLATAFRSWRSFDAPRRAAAEAALRDLASRNDLSRDLSDILTRTLG
ncbi:aminopeptidase N [Aureimonas ureilytica]|uniref:Aminopeptidase N n=1 Tax=Aureimonas ureilytica TaxID=401562 RepID=A0A175RQ05_9HYPH|nr:aminopeptidase N [Aureimonas ureilytica]KTR04942.1 aminopeptidase N [Aureimonas ureilytica]